LVICNSDFSIFVNIKYKAVYKHLFNNISISMKDIQGQISKLLDSYYNELDVFAKRLSFKKNDFILKEGQSAYVAFYITKGITRNFKYHDGNEITLQFNFKNDLVFPLNAYNTNLKSDEYIQAITDVEVIKTDLNDFEKLKKENSDYYKLEIKINELQSLQIAKRLRNFQTLSAKDRYLELIKTEPHILQFCSLTHIASYLGINLGSLSRIRNSL